MAGVLNVGLRYYVVVVGFVFLCHQRFWLPLFGLCCRCSSIDFLLTSVLRQEHVTRLDLARELQPAGSRWGCCGSQSRLSSAPPVGMPGQAPDPASVGNHSAPFQLMIFWSWFWCPTPGSSGSWVVARLLFSNWSPELVHGEQTCSVIELLFAMQLWYESWSSYLRRLCSWATGSKSLNFLSSNRFHAVVSWTRLQGVRWNVCEGLN
jgi:hypothetical protein